MADQGQVQPVEGAPAPAVARPAPIPRRTAQFRTAAQPGHAMPAPAPPAFPISQGLGPMIPYMDGYDANMTAQTGLTTCVPSYINMSARCFLTNQRLAGNDKFLKETNVYHPDLFDLYISFIFLYHILRVRSQTGNLSASEDTLLSNLRHYYPENALPVPGTIYEVLASITATENPYPWFGNITANLPDNTNYRGANHAYLVANNFHTILPCPLLLVNKIYALTRIAGNLTDAQVNALNLLPHSLNGNVSTSADAEANYMLTPHGRFPGVTNARIANAFKTAVFGQAASPFLSQFVLDLPKLAPVTSTANLTLSDYLGVVDAPGSQTATQPRRTVYLRWPTQAASMVAVACKYISGSRHLSDVATTGLGALSPVCIYQPTVILDDRAVNVVQPGAAAAITDATAQNYHLTSLDAVLEIHDPMITGLAVQHAAICQVNVDLSNVSTHDPTVAFTSDPLHRMGTFWTMPISNRAPEAAIANILVSHLPNFIRSNPRRDGAE